VPQKPRDPFSGLQYQRLIDWGARLQRETPFLLQALQSGPTRSLLDLGCGTGEHAAHFARLGFRVVGLERSPAQLEQARKHLGNLPLRFVEGDLERPGEHLEERFGSAFCLGNTLVSVLEREGLEAACGGVHAALEPGGSWVIQILNYARILSRGQRSLPVQLFPDDGDELVFLRLLRPLPDQRLQFFATTLRLRHDAEVPLEVVASHATQHRTWLRGDLEDALGGAGFTRLRWFGDLRGTPFEEPTSSDLVCVATR
jgi:SAM-dependent methyltransferase